MVGIDIVDIKKLRRKHKNFFSKVFTSEELNYANKKDDPFKSLAGIYALKEAVIKSLDLNLYYILRKKIKIYHKDNKPYVIVNDDYLIDNVSISHDGDYAIGICNYEKYINKYNIDPNISKLLPKRDKFTNKGDYGKIAILGGSLGMSGSVYMSARASLRSGSGLTYILTPSSICNILSYKTIEEIIIKVPCEQFSYNEEISNYILSNLENKDVLAIGMGMGLESSLNKLLNNILTSFRGKIVIDADALNALSKDITILHKNKNIILTPHLKEFSRLTKKSIQDIKANKVDLARKFAKEHGVILVLKDYETVVTDGNRLYINKNGNPGMATAGSGDVLTGIIASLSHRLSLYDASCLAVHVHSLAGDLAKDKYSEESMIASDIIANLGEAFKILGRYEQESNYYRY